MKTFDEALSMIVRQGTGEAAAHLGIEAIGDIAAKHQSIVKEAQENTKLAAYLGVTAGITFAQSQDFDTFQTALGFACFMAGVIVGMEMEKHE